MHEFLGRHVAVAGCRSGERRRIVFALPVIHYPDNKDVGMKEVELNKHKVRVYDSIDELPIVRFHAYNRMLLVDAGIGSDISDFDSHIERVVAYIRKGENDNASKELNNLRQNVYMIMQGQSVRDLSFACLVKSIDGVPCDDLSPEGLEKVLKQLGGSTRKELDEVFHSVKKKNR